MLLSITFHRNNNMKNNFTRNIKIAENISMNLNDILLIEINVRDAYVSYYNYIPEHDYEEIIGRLQPETDQVKYTTRWVFDMYKKHPQDTMAHLRTGLLHSENGTGFLDIFDRVKTLRLINGAASDINTYKTFSELRDLVSRFNVEELRGNNTQRKKRNMTDEQKAAKNDIDVVYQDEKWYVLVPRSYEAAVYWGSDTKWCTSYKDSRNFYDNYSQKGKLYININKETREKYQFHFETDSFMDSNDYRIPDPILKEIGATEGLENFYKENIHPNLLEYLIKPEMFDIVEQVMPDVFIAKKKLNMSRHLPYTLRGEYTFIDSDQYILDNMGFDEWQIYEELGVKTKCKRGNIEDFFIYERKQKMGSIFYINAVEVYEETNTVLAINNDKAYIYTKGDRDISSFTIEGSKKFGDKTALAIYDSNYDTWLFYDGDFVLDEPIYDFLRFDGEYIKYEDETSVRLMDIHGNQIFPEENEYSRIMVINDNMFFVRLLDSTASYLVDRDFKKLSKYEYSITKRCPISYEKNEYFYMVMRKDDNKINFITQDGRFLSPYIWLDDADGKLDYHCTPPDTNKPVRCMSVGYEGKDYYLDLEGRLYDSECNFLSDLSDGNVKVESKKHLLKSINENLNDIFKL